MEIQKDFKELFECFNAHSVSYLIVGGYAMAFHGAPRFTGDIDLYVKPDPANAERILKALDMFGFGGLDLAVEDFLQPDKVVQLGVPPVRIDLVTSISGVSWEDAFKGAMKGYYGDAPVLYLGRDAFILNKKATGRKRDAADLEALGEG
jgi:hypothetical protein